jgi:N-acetylglucosaminyldiphosphoundecaprenol N-acetyl-beta-D-mannosaminyltransferase
VLGGADGVAETVCGILNSRPSGILCVGWLNPGFGSIEEMSSEDIIEKINNSQADLLAVFFNARKAQAWLLRNHDRLSVPVRGQFGATINYQAGTVRRAPRVVQKLGLEWLWRIKEEPYLWRRYWADGLSLIGLVIFRALPIATGLWWHRSIFGSNSNELHLRTREHQGSIIISLIGHATANNAKKSIEFFRNALNENRNVVIDVSETRSIDPRFFGLLLMLRKQLRCAGNDLIFTGATKRISRDFYLNGFTYLLESDLKRSSVEV